jgi:Antitoxin Phd_YefM, type II toxin-antitoxin system
VIGGVRLSASDHLPKDARQMPAIGVYEAKTHLPNLLERVRKGERFVITRHGQPVAELIRFR